MKTVLHITFICLLNMCIYNSVSAQKTAVADTSSNKKVADSTVNKPEIEFPPLQDLIDSAIKHNAMVGYRNLEIDAKTTNLTSERNSWLRTLGIQGDSRYGTIDAFSTNSNGVSSNFSNTTNKQLNYAAGVYIKIPLYEILNRKTQIKQAKIELDEAKTMATAQQDEIRQVVIRQYEEVLLKQKLLNIKSLNLGSATVNMEMVEKEFRNGIIPVTEYVRISDMTARIQSDYELAKSEFLVAKKILEEIAGFTFKNPELKEK